jgi:hypothetical protein
MCHGRPDFDCNVLLRDQNAAFNDYLDKSEPEQTLICRKSNIFNGLMSNGVITIWALPIGHIGHGPIP